MAGRLTQEAVEVVMVTTPASIKARVTQEAVEVATVTTPASIKARVTQEVVEVLQAVSKSTAFFSFFGH